MQLLDQQLCMRNPLTPDRYEATFDTEDNDAPAPVPEAGPPVAAAAPEALSPRTAEAMLGFGGGASARRPPKRPVAPAATAAATASCFARPLPLLHVPPPPVSPPEGWSAAPSPLALEEDSTHPLPFQVDWAKELLIATGDDMMGQGGSPPSRNPSVGPEAEEQQSPQQQQQQPQWQPTEPPEPSPPPQPAQAFSVVPLFILQRRERERERAAQAQAQAQEQRRAPDDCLEAAAGVAPGPFEDAFSHVVDNADDANDAEGDTTYDDDFECEQKEESAPSAAAAAAVPPLRPSSARPAPLHRPSTRSSRVMRPLLKPSASGRDDDTAISFFTAEQPSVPQGHGPASVASQAPFFNVRTHRGKRKPLSGK